MTGDLQCNLSLHMRYTIYVLRIRSYSRGRINPLYSHHLSYNVIVFKARKLFWKKLRPNWDLTINTKLTKLLVSGSRHMVEYCDLYCERRKKNIIYTFFVLTKSSVNHIVYMCVFDNHCFVSVHKKMYWHFCASCSYWGGPVLP